LSTLCSWSNRVIRSTAIQYPQRLIAERTVLTMTWQTQPDGRRRRHAVLVDRVGGPEGIRTPGLVSAIHALSQLSYGPTTSRKRGGGRVYPRSYTRPEWRRSSKASIRPRASTLHESRPGRPSPRPA